MTHGSAIIARRTSSCAWRCRLRRGLAGLALATSGLTSAQGVGDALVTVPAQLKFGVEELGLPGGERLGLVGTSYLIGIGQGLAVGPAAYGAISGRRGGLFTLGGEAAWLQRVAGPLAVELGMYVGGGGGGGAPVGGGLMLRPHADVLWDFGPFLAGLSWSRVRFPSGSIDSRQAGLVWRLKTDFRYVPRDLVGRRFDAGRRSGAGFDRIRVVFGAYMPRAGAMRVSGAPLDSNIGFVGARVERAIDDQAYWGLEVSGAASGGVAGYAEYLATLGAETTVWPGALTLGGRLALGMGGGGDIDVGGGLLTKGGLYGTVRLTREWGLSLEGGYTAAPQGSFKARHVAAALEWTFDVPRDRTAPPRTTRTEWMAGAERHDALRRDGSHRMLQAVTLKVNRFVTQHLYLTGQAHSAYSGGAGGYTVGLIGAGVQTRLVGPLLAGAEALIGAAGGGGVATHGGAIMQPNAYLGVDVSRSLSVRVGAGRIRSLRRGGLDAKVIDVGLAFTFGVAGQGDR